MLRATVGQPRCRSRWMPPRRRWRPGDLEGKSTGRVRSSATLPLRAREGAELCGRRSCRPGVPVRGLVWRAPARTDGSEGHSWLFVPRFVRLVRPSLCVLALEHLVLLSGDCLVSQRVACA